MGRRGSGVTPDATYGVPTGGGNIAVVFSVGQTSTITMIVQNRQTSAKSGTINLAAVSNDYYTACVGGTLGAFPSVGQTCTITYAKNGSQNEEEFSFAASVSAGKYVLWTAGTIASNIYIKRVEINAAAACTAPDHVNVTGRWDRFAGETINLTATAYDGSDAEIAAANITGYQWQKLEGSTWTNVSNGTVSGATTTGATAKNLQITNCGAGNSGKYRCVVSTGATCSTPSATATDGSQGFGVKVYVLECYTGGTTEHHFTRIGDSQAGTLTMNLTANTAYTFKVHADNTYYGNNGTINKDETNWVMCNSDNGGDCAKNLTVNSGLGGTFTFGIEYSTSGSSSVEGEPEISVTYPRKTMYLVPNSDWLSNSAKFAFYYYGTSGTGWTDFLSSNECGMSADIPQWNGLNVIAVRFNPSDATPGWNGDGHVWNQTGDITATADKNCVTITDWNTGTYGTYSIPTYTISYNAGTGGSGSKSNETKTCGVDFTLPNSAVFTRTGYTQTGWAISDGGSQAYALGGSYTTNEDKTFYPVWTVNNYDLTWNLAGGTTTSAGTGIGSGVSSNTTTSQAFGTALTAPTVTKTGYNFSAWSPAVASTMPAANTTYTAQWTAKTTTITIDANTANHGSTAPSSITATYGSALPSFTAATGASGYSLTGYFTAATDGTKVINADGSLVRNTTYSTDESTPKWKSEAASLTLYPQYEEEVVSPSKCITFNSTSAPSVSGVTIKKVAGKSGGSTYTEDGFVMSQSGDYITFDISALGYLTKATFTAKTGSTSKKIGYGYTDAASYVDEVPEGDGTADKNFHEYEITSIPDNTTRFTLVRRGTGTTITEVCLFYTPISCSTPAAPTAFTAGSITSTGATFTITDAANAASYDIYYATSSTAPNASTPATTTSTSKTKEVTGLTASTTYYAWVRSVCDASHKSDWVALTGSSFTTSAAAGTTYYLVTSTAQLNTTDTYVIMEASGAAMMGIATGSNSYLNAITSGFTAAADKSTVTVTSSDVNTLTLKSESDAWNLFGKDNHYITTNSTVNGNLYGNATSGSGTDDFVFSFTDGKAIINRPSSSYHIYYSSGTGFNQSTSSTNIRLYTSNSMPVYTVTYDLNGGTGTVPTNRPEKSGTSITLASSTGLTKDGFTFDGWLCSVNSTKYAAGASYTMTAANTTFTAQWEAVSGYTVTYKYNGATSGATPTSETGTSVTLPTPTRTGYELDGWYTTAGEKVGNGGETYGPEADITLYARWQEACDAEGVAKSTTDVAASGYTTYQEVGGSNVAFTSAPSLGFKYKDADGNTINNSTTAVVRNNAYSCKIQNSSSNKGSIKTNSTFSNVDSISFYFAASDKGGCQIAVWCSTDNFSTDSTSLLSATTYADNNNEFKLKTLPIPSGKKASALRFKFRFTVTSSGKTSYIDSLKVYSSTSGGGTCYHVYYHGNGAESGYVNDTVSYTAGSKATVLNYNYGRNPLAKTGYDFRGWATSASGAVAYSAGQKIDITSADVDLYAVWATARTALVNWTMGTNTSTWSATATSTTDGTNITSIGTARTNGSDGKREGATAKVTMATAEVTGSAAPSNSANFTFTIAGGKQVEINKFDCQVFNVASGSRTYKAQISDGAGNVYNSTNTVAVSAEASLTDASFVFGSGKILRGDVTIRVYAWGSGSEFRMGPDVKFYGTVGDYSCATPAAPTISGVSEYVPGQTITLTASHDGENYDNLTTYTWYKGADWATASGTTPVQAAATGESGYTLTIADCTTGDAGLYWCEAANGTCKAHSAAGYDVTVFPAYTITYNLNGGTLDGTEKTSYTQFDEDYTLPTPTKTGYVFAGWYGASDFSGLPTVVLGAGSVGNKEYYAKWGAVVTVSWTVTKVDDKLYRGGGGYSVKAVIDQTTWNESYKDQLELTATEGVTLKNIVASVVSSHVQVTADFDITTGLAADATEIAFTLDVPADGTYGPKVDEHEETLTSCGGGFDTDNSYVIGKSNSDATNISSSAALRAYKTASDWYSKGNTTFTDKTSTDGFTISAAEKSYYWQNNGTFTESSSSNCRLKTIKLAKSNGVTIRWTNDELSFSKVRFIGRNTAADDPTMFTVSNGTTEKTFTFEAGNSEIQTKEVTMDFVSGDTKGIVISGGTKEINILIELIPTSVGGVTPTLTWDDGDADIANDGVSKSTSNDDFVYTASQDKNSLGAITYSSSDATVATVNATTGQVHLVGAAGTATITATIAASGCFSSANVSYTITVTDDCDDEAGTITTEDLGCSGIKMTVTGHTAAAGVIYQWYKVGTPSDETVGTNQDNFTATEAGSYYVIVTNTGDRHCAKRSTNTITVEAQAAATITKIVDSWYVKKDRRTPDIELVKATNATSFTVKIGSTVIWNSDSTNTTGFAGCGFHMGENGIIYLNGTKDNGDAPAHDDGTWAAGDETLTITAIGCGGNASQNITIHKQAATDYKEIAFVVDGEKGKGFDQVTSLHADGTELYEYLDTVTAAGNRLFKLTERNIYSTTDEKAIREEYSQFDGILITDDPSTNTVVKTGDDYKTKGYVNAFGTMVDVRPIFTMEAYVSALKNWGSKGIKGNPQSPNPRQYEMRLECKDHEIYGAGLPTPEDGTNVWEEVVDGETFRHVILVDSTLGIYKGVKYNQETKGNEKPALQGFTGEAAGSLLGLGRILEGTLQAAIERQEEPAARLLVMGINAKALQPTCALTDEGKTVIKNILVYLLKTNMEEVDDCSNYFTGKYDNDWSKAGNWSKNQLPSSEAKVRILAPCVISGIQPHVLQVSIVNSGNSNIRNTARGSAVCDGTLTIEPDGALIADGKIRSAVAPHFAANDLMPTTPEMLTINTNGSGQAALIFNNDAGDTKATVNLYSLGRTLSGANQFQYMAVPMEYVAVNPAFANEHNDGKLIYTYVWHENGGWERRGYYTDLYAFEGVGITTTDTEARIYTMEGNLASTAERTIALTHDSKPAYGNNIIGNSWMAPIDIASLKNAIGDDAAVMKTVYIYCTGKDPANATSNSLETAGQWLAIPIDAAGWSGWGGVKVIPAMQAFLIRVSSETSLTLNYNEMVRTTATENLNVPLRAPRRKVEGEDVNKAISLTRMRVADSKTCTDLYLFEGSDFSGEFDNGWEATYMPGDGRSAQFYAMEEKTKMAVLATDELEGTPVCFAPGKESNYTISFFGGDGTYYLNDLKEQTSTLIEQGNTYSFIYEAGDMPQRFLISSTPFEKPGVATGTETVNNSEKARKVVYQDKIYIIRGGRIYDVVGKMVK